MPYQYSVHLTKFNAHSNQRVSKFGPQERLI